MAKISHIWKHFDADELSAGELSESQELYLKTLLKLHQVFALIDVDWSKATAGEEHFSEILESMKQHGGLEYLPRERTADGRVFEHASECSILLKHLMRAEQVEVKDLTNKPIFQVVVSGKEEEQAQEGCKLKKELIKIAIKSNGHLELYFHGYVIYSYVSYVAGAIGKSAEEFEAIVKANPELARLQVLD